MAPLTASTKEGNSDRSPGALSIPQGPSAPDIFSLNHESSITRGNRTYILTASQLCSQTITACAIMNNKNSVLYSLIMLLSWSRLQSGDACSASSPQDSPSSDLSLLSNMITRTSLQTTEEEKIEPKISNRATITCCFSVFMLLSQLIKSSHPRNLATLYLVCQGNDVQNNFCCSFQLCLLAFFSAP